MKAEIIEMLAFPRQLMRGEVDLETCEHAGNYASSDPRCRVCETRLECEWLYHSDESAALGEKPLAVLLDALGSAVLYVDACLYRSGHDPALCRCAACGWLRRAQRAHESAERSS